MTATDRIALLIALLAVLGGGLVARQVYENMAHLEDEFAYRWQAQVMARGELALPSPEFPDSFLVPFVVDYQGLRFGKYPLGWPVVLSLGIRLGIENWINPLLGGLAVWLTYRVAKRMFGEIVGLLASLLMGLSPFFLIQVGSQLSHGWSLLLSMIFISSWWDSISPSREEIGKIRWLPTVIAGLSLGLLGLTRPLTMIALAVVAGVYGAGIFLAGKPGQKQRILVIGGLALLLASLHFVWQWAVTGDPFLNPYTLWWPYDKLGFGEGVGVLEQGHSFRQAWWNTKHSLRVGVSDLFGWGTLSFVILPFGLWAARKRAETYFLLGFFLSLVGVYLMYWIGSWLLGPRYYFESLPGLAILTAVGFAWLAGWPIQPDQSPRERQGWERVRPLAVFSLMNLLLFTNLWFYLPARLESLRGLYSIEQADILPFTNPQAESLTPALVLVHSDRWMSYGSVLQLSSPFQDSPFLFAWSIGPGTDRAITSAYQEARRIYHYYPDHAPGKLYGSPVRDWEESFP